MYCYFFEQQSSCVHDHITSQALSAAHFTLLT